MFSAQGELHTIWHPAWVDEKKIQEHKEIQKGDHLQQKEPQRQNDFPQGGRGSLVGVCVGLFEGTPPPPPPAFVVLKENPKQHRCFVGPLEQTRPRVSPLVVVGKFKVPTPNLELPEPMAFCAPVSSKGPLEIQSDQFLNHCGTT